MQCTGIAGERNHETKPINQRGVYFHQQIRQSATVNAFHLWVTGNLNWTNWAFRLIHSFYRAAFFIICSIVDASKGIGMVKLQA